jgi:hypothetical protein
MDIERQRQRDSVGREAVAGSGVTPRRMKGLFWLWTGFLGGAIAWSLFHLFGYLWATLDWALPSRAFIVGTALVTGALTVASIWLCWKSWREAGRGGGDRIAGYPDDARTIAYMGLTGIYLNAFFLASILLTTLAVLFLRGHGQFPG